MSLPPDLPFGPEFGFGLYVHWPYCARICPYCDFNVYAAKDRETGPLVAAILADIRAHRDRLPAHPVLDSIYFGGGTPSLMAPSDLERLVSAAGAAFGLSPSCEITLEANPNDILRGSPADWLAAGVNRLSVGLQSIADDALSFLGRDHSAAEGMRAVEGALAYFKNVSVDLIYARPGQSASAWKQELEQVLALGAPHLSLYELTIEERTAFGRRAARGDLIPMPDDDQATLYELTGDLCESRGLPAYEISNHARGEAFRSRHNLIYWRGGDWIGVGPGAHGRLTVDGQRLATLARRRPDEYAAQPRGLSGQERLDPRAAGEELLLMGLRPTHGISRKRVETALEAAISEPAWRDCVENGLVVGDGDRLALTPAGRLLADRIGGALLG